MPFPNYTVGPNPPDQQNQGDLWFNTTTQQLCVQNGTNFQAITQPAITSAMTASQAGVVGAPMLIPCTTGTMGGSGWPIPAGHVGIAYDITANRLNVVASGGGTFRTVACT